MPFLPAFLSLAIASTSARAADPDPWYLGEWKSMNTNYVCVGLRLKAQQVAEFGIGNGTPCHVTAWETTRYTESGTTLNVKVSIASKPVAFRLDPAAKTVGMPSGTVPMERVDASAPPPASPDLGSVNPGDPTRYELPGRVSVSTGGGWSQMTNGERIIFTHGKREMVMFHPVPLAQLGTKMLEVGKTVESQYEFKKMDTDQMVGGIQARVFDSETKRLSDGFTGTRMLLIEACCGEALVVLALTAGTSEATMWRNVDQLLGSMKESELAVDPGCAAPAKKMKTAMSTLTSSTWGETLRKQLVVGASALGSELAGRVGTEGPSAADQAWAECATNAMGSVDDVAKGVWQMNKGNYAHEWVQTGRFGTDQERMLDDINDPGVRCGDWVKGQFRADTLAPIGTYLTARDKMDELNCPTNPPPGAANGG